MKAAWLVVPLSMGLAYLCYERVAHEEPHGSVQAADEPESLTSETIHAACAVEREALLARITKLEAQLGAARADSLQREESWLEYNRMIVSIAPEEVFPELHAAKVQEALADREPAAPDPALVARQERSRQIRISLNALFRTEGIDAFDLLEIGLLGEGSIGPVLLRSFDDRGRAIGSISAERLRLEGSRAGRTLTIILEDGYTRRSGERVAFPGAEGDAERGGVMRIVIPQTDPKAWSRAVPELFKEDHTREIIDDGKWNRFILRRELNSRLDRAGLGGRYVLKDVAGVREGVMHDVALDELAENGALRRRLFADRLTLLVDTAGVQMLLQDGVVLRGDQKLPFLDGRMRVFLPRANVAEWTDGTLPVTDLRQRSAEATAADADATEGDTPTAAAQEDSDDASVPTDSAAQDSDPDSPDGDENDLDSTDSALPR